MDSLTCAALKSWFEAQQRALPWRERITPYRVWVSEIMLQQTQASAVIPYFERFMARFPTLEELAHSPSELVLKLWEGLGYYARVRNLQRAAQIVVARYGGQVPIELEELRSLPGVGPYTAAAIRCFAYDLPAAAVDTNVLRVMARYYALTAPLGSKQLEKEVTARVIDLLPVEQPRPVMEGLIELGALVCGKVPKCDRCPLQSTCLAYQNRLVEQLPVPKERTKTIRLYKYAAIIEYEGALLVQKVAEGRVMEGLHEFHSWSVNESFIDLSSSTLAPPNEALITEFCREIAAHPVYLTDIARNIVNKMDQIFNSKMAYVEKATQAEIETLKTRLRILKREILPANYTPEQMKKAAQVLNANLAEIQNIRTSMEQIFSNNIKKLTPE